MRVTPENNPQRPTQHLEYEPIKKMETGPEEPKRQAPPAKRWGPSPASQKEFSSFP
jgi:membrane protein